MHTARKVLANEDAAQDVVQEVFIAAWTNLKVLEASQDLKLYSFGGLGSAVATAFSAEALGAGAVPVTLAALAAYTDPVEAPDGRYSYASSNPSMATVNFSGAITAVSAGAAIITVREAKQGFIPISSERVTNTAEDTCCEARRTIEQPLVGCD